MAELRESSVIPSPHVAALHGVRESVTVPSPVAGAEWSLTISGGYYRHIVMGIFTFTTSATVANRAVVFQIGNGSSTVWQSVFPGAVQGASIAEVFSIAPNVTSQFSAGAGRTQNICIPDVWLPPGYTIGSATGALQATDQYSAITIDFECVERETLRSMAPVLEVDITEA